MGICYSGEHIAGDHIHKEITRYNTAEPQRKYRLGTGDINMFYWIQTLVLSLCSGSKHFIHMKE